MAKKSDPSLLSNLLGLVFLLALLIFVLFSGGSVLFKTIILLFGIGFFSLIFEKR